MRVEIIDITDRSGSMQDIRNDIIGGFNALIEDQKKLPGEARLTYVQFDHEYHLQYAAKNIQTVEPLTLDGYIPTGTTALLDGIGRTLDEQGKRIAAEKWADKVIVCIRTDGFENASRDYKLDRVKEMIKHAQEHGWTFIFSGADIDAFAAGANLGISGQHTRGYSKSDPLGTTQSYAFASSTIADFRTGIAPKTCSDAKVNVEIKTKVSL